MGALGLMGASLWAQPADQNFDSQSLGAPGGNSVTIGGIIYTNNDSRAIDIVNDGDLGDGGADHSLAYRSSAANASTQVGFRTADGSEFKLNSFAVSTGFGGTTNLTIKGFRDNVEVVSASYDLGGIFFGTFNVSANASWENIDEVRILGADLDVDIDDLDFSPPVVPNAAPVVANLNGDSVAFTEGGSALALDASSNATVTDGDSADFNSGNVTVAIVTNRASGEDLLAVRHDGNGAGQIGVSGNTISYGGTTIGTSAGGSGTNDLVISLNASSSPASVQALLRALTYQNSNSTDPSTSSRTVRVTVNDGDGGTSTNADITVSVTGVNDAPTLAANGGAPTFTENGSGVDLFGGVSVGTAESGQTIVQLVLTVTNVADGASEILNADGTAVALTNGNGGTTSGNSLTYSVSAAGGTATVTLSKVGGVSAATAATLVDGLSYQNNSDAPSTSNRVVTLTSVRDSGGTANGGVDTTALSISATVTVAATNDAPVVTPSGGTTAYTEGGAPIIIDGSLTLADPDNATLASGTVSITGNFQSGQDVLSFTNDGSTMGNVSASYSSGTGVLTLSSAGATATLAQWQAALRTVAYVNSSATPSTAVRTLSFDVSDGTTNSNAGTKSVSVTAVNNPPVNTVPGSQTFAQDSNRTFNSGNSNLISVADVDAGGSSIQVTLTATHGTLNLSGSTGLSFLVGSGTGDATMTFTGTITNLNNALNGLVFVPTSGYSGSASLQIATNDQGNTGTGGAQTDTDTISLTITTLNPFVASVSSSTANGTYKVGDTIAVTVTFDQSVAVNTGGGTPSLLLETGAVDRNATYVSGSGTTVLTFNYTVQAGDVSVDLDYQNTGALVLNGGTIRNVSSQDAVMTLPAVGGGSSLAGQKAIVVDGVAPTVASVAVPANATYGVGQNLNFTVNFSEAVTVTGTPSIALTLDTGGTVAASYVSGSGTTALVFRHTVSAGTADSNGITVGSTIALNAGTVRDAAGNNAVLTLNSVAATAGVLVDALVPTIVSANRVSASPTKVTSLAYTVVFSKAVTGVDASDFTLTATGTAAATIGTVTPVSATNYTVDLTGVAGDGTLRLDLKASGTGITDTVGNPPPAYTSGQLYTIDNTAPTFTSAATAVANLGSLSFTLTANESPVTFAATGLPAGLALNPTSGVLTGTVGQVGTFTVAVTATDAAGNVGSGSLAITMSKISATVAIGNLSQVYNGQPRGVDVTTTPANLATTVSYIGSTSTPVNAGTYPVTVAVTDANYVGSAAAVLTITKATQTVTFGSASTATIATALTLSATATSGLPVTYAVVSGNATIAGGSLTSSEAGTVVVRATQAGNSNYESATATQTITVSGKRAQTITFAALSDRTVGDASFTLPATASSGLPVTFTLVGGPASLSGSTVSLSGAEGTVTIRASQAGDAVYAPAPDVVRTFVVSSPGLQVFFGRTSAGDPVGIVLQRNGTTGTFACAIPGTRDGFVAAFTLAVGRTFEFSVPSLGSPVALTAIDGRAVAAAGAVRTFRGTVGNASVTGSIVELGVTFSADLQPGPGTSSDLAGFYESSIANSASGGVYAVVSPTGGVMVMTITPTLVTAASTTLAAGNRFDVTTAQGAQVSGTFDTATLTFTGTLAVTGRPTAEFTGLNATAARTDRLVNLSSRARVSPTGGRTLVTGFVIAGPASKRVLLRAVGPALSGLGVSDALPNPRLQLFNASGQVVSENDDWSGADTAATFGQVGAFGLTAGGRDAAMVVTLAPGAYTMQVQDSGGTGVALAEIYDAGSGVAGEAQRLVNISSRGLVEAGDGALIGGFVVTGNVPKRVLVRGIGPALAGFGITGALVDPRLAVYRGTTVVAQNDDWSTPQPVNASQVAATAAEIAAAAQGAGAFALAASSRDAAIVVTLAPGAYTAQVTGAGTATGTALVEIYELQP